MVCMADWFAWMPSLSAIGPKCICSPTASLNWRSAFSCCLLRRGLAADSFAEGLGIRLGRRFCPGPHAWIVRFWNGAWNQICQRACDLTARRLRRTEGNPLRETVSGWPGYSLSGCHQVLNAHFSHAQVWCAIFGFCYLFTGLIYRLPYMFLACGVFPSARNMGCGQRR